MKWSIIRYVPALWAVLCFQLPALAQNDSLSLGAVNEKYERRISRYHRHWEKLIPTYGKVQYAGNMGFLSFGPGWDYGRKKQWETDILVGFLPKFSSKKAKATFTVKQNYVPWTLPLGKGFSADPLSCGIYLNTVFGDQFWVREPDRYPKGYYWFSSKIRVNACLGQRVSYDIDPQKRFLAKRITLFYELSTCDFYMIARVHNHSLRPRDYMSLSFGLKLQWL